MRALFFVWFVGNAHVRSHSCLSFASVVYNAEEFALETERINGHHFSFLLYINSQLIAMIAHIAHAVDFHMVVLLVSVVVVGVTTKRTSA